MKKFTFFLPIILMITLLISGCASKSSYETNSFKGGKITQSKGEEDFTTEESQDNASEEQEGGDADGFMVQTSDEAGVDDSKIISSQMGNKIIQSGTLTLETLDFDGSISAIKRKVNQTGGFIAQSNIDGKSRYSKTNRMRTAYFNLRIPKDKLEQFMNDVGDLGDVTHSEVTGEDVSAEYYDTEARLETLKVQEDRLLAILSEAEELTDIIELERELSSVRYDIESLTGSLKKWDNLVEFSTLDIDVYEVEEYREEEAKSLGEKIVQGFKTSLKNVLKLSENILIFSISAIPFVALFSILGMAIYFIVKSILKIIKK